MLAKQRKPSFRRSRALRRRHELTGQNLVLIDERRDWLGVRKTTALLRVLEVEGREPCFRSLICGITASVMRIFFARLVNRNSLRSS
jgi:hypothetical protein